MIGEVFAQHVGRIDGHRTVQVDRDVLQAPSLPQLPEIIEKRLGASNREGGDDNRPAAADGALHDRAQRLGGVGWVMNAVAISRLDDDRSEEHTSELQSLMRISYAVFCLKKKKKKNTNTQ